MWKKVVIYLLLWWDVFSLNKLFAVTMHLETLTSKFPYALIGDDFGVLSLDDLAINSCIAEPSAFTIKDSPGYPYWQCFDARKARIFCSGHKYSEDYNNFSTLLVIAAEKNGFRHEYYSRRAVDYDVCKEFVSDWENLTKNEKYVCLSGPYIEQEKDKNGIMVSYWIFDKFKTKKGCMPYFQYGCSLAYQLKSGACNSTSKK